MNFCSLLIFLLSPDAHALLSLYYLCLNIQYNKIDTIYFYPLRLIRRATDKIANIQALTNEGGQGLLFVTFPMLIDEEIIHDSINITMGNAM